MLLQQKFFALFQGTINANKLDAKDVYEANATTNTIAYARKDFSSLNDNAQIPGRLRHLLGIK